MNPKNLLNTKFSLFPIIMISSMIIYIYFLTSFLGKSKADITKYTASIKVVIKGSSNPYQSIYATYHDLKQNYRSQIAVAKKCSKSGIYKFKFDLRETKVGLPAFINIGEDKIKVFLKPSSHLDVLIDMNHELLSLENIKFVGDMADACSYYRDKKLILGSDFYVNEIPNSKEQSSHYVTYLDEKAKKELHFLKKYTKNLSTDFVTYEQNEIKYGKAYLTLHQIAKGNLNKNLQGKIQLNNPDAIYSLNYYKYLKVYIANQTNSQTVPVSMAKTNHCDITKAQFFIANKYLKDEVLMFFLSQLRYSSSLNKECEDITKMIQDRYDLIKEVGGAGALQYQRDSHSIGAK